MIWVNIGSGNGLLPDKHQATTWTQVGSLLKVLNTLCDLTPWLNKDTYLNPEMNCTWDSGLSGWSIFHTHHNDVNLNFKLKYMCSLDVFY